MNNKINLVSVATGSYDDYSEKTIFATKDKEKDLKWVERFNNIVQDNTKRIMNFDCDDNKNYNYIYMRTIWNPIKIIFKLYEIIFLQWG